MRRSILKGVTWFAAIGVGVVGVVVITRPPAQWRAEASANYEPYARARQARAVYFTALDSLDSAVADLAQTAQGTPVDAQGAFRRARLRYKRIEALVEYYSPRTARAVNGPALDRAEPDEATVIIPASGFQVIEEALFPAPAPDWASVVTGQSALLQRHLALIRRTAAETEPTDGHIFDALRLELTRIVTLGLAGFDASLSNDGVREAVAAMRGLVDLSGPYQTDRHSPAVVAAWDTLENRLAGAALYLDAHPDFARLDRLAFIVGYANPAARALDDVRQRLGVALPEGSRTWAADAATVFDQHAFDPHAFAPTYTPRATPQLVALGRELFFDPALSGDGSRACAFCHQPERAFTDGRARRQAVTSVHDEGGRNTPTLINVGLQPASFFDQRTAFLEDQVADVLKNPAEMGQPVERAAMRLQRSAEYTARFATTFGEAQDSTVSAARLRIAIAAYLRSLQALDSRVDRALRGDTAALTASEQRGFTIFMGKGKCATCHFLPLFNGVTPPTFTEAEPEVIGVPTRPVTRGATLDPDPGQYTIDRITLHRHAFKTPTLRNVALTAPYMHNGVYRTLDEVVDFYDRGGGAGIGLRIENQTLPPDKLGLNLREKRDLVEFLKALTSPK